MSRYDLTDSEWRVIEPLLPNKPGGVPRVDDRRVLNGIFWVLRSGAPWRDLPEPQRCVEMRLNWRRRPASGSLSWRQCAAGLRNRLRRLTDIGQPRVVLSLSCLNQKSTLCCSAMRTLRTAGRAAGNEDFHPCVYNSRREFKSGGKFFI